MDEPLLRPNVLRSLSVSELAARLTSLAVADDRLLRVLARDHRAGVRALAARLRRRRGRDAKERARLQALRTIEEEHRAQGFAIIAGVDEAGVAPLAGPVVAAAVVLPENLHIPHLNDSKRLTAPQRDTLYAEILRDAVAVSVGSAMVDEIDRLNILQAMRLAHRRAILGLPRRPHLVLIDGRYPADAPVPQLAIVDGDASSASIAAASIVAKVSRDRMMTELARVYPQYGFEQHKGYGTRAHIAAMERFGVTPAHRRSFRPVRGRQQALSIG